MDEWDLTLGDPFEYAFVSLPIGVKLSDGTDAVLKIQYPHDESDHEATALAQWDGDGAVRLFAEDPSRNALLIERCIPGSHLGQAEEPDKVQVLIDLLPRLWRPAGKPYRSLEEEAKCWAQNLSTNWERTGRPFDRNLLDAARDALFGLAESQGEQVLLHQDLHAGNILRAEREPWLVIDPKPLAGEREFTLAPIVRSAELGGGERKELIYRLDRITDEFGLDRERARLWTLGQSVAWCFDSAYISWHVEVATAMAES